MVAVTRLTGALITLFEEQCHDNASWNRVALEARRGRWERPAL